jgi:hypothetical protein
MRMTSGSTAMAERLLDRVIEVGLVARQPRSESDVVVDRLGERVRLLEHHADPLADLDRIDAGVVEIDTVIQDLALDTGRFDQIVHAVEATKHGRLAATGRADERRDLVLSDLEVDITHGLEVAVEDVESLDVEHDLRLGRDGRGRHIRRTGRHRFGGDGVI